MRRRKSKDKIREFRLRYQQTGSTAIGRAKAHSVMIKLAGARGEEITLSQAVAEYLSEGGPGPHGEAQAQDPVLKRLTSKTKPPPGFVMYGPKDVAEAIAEYLQVEPDQGREPREEQAVAPKVMENRSKIKFN